MKSMIPRHRLLTLLWLALVATSLELLAACSATSPAPATPAEKRLLTQFSLSQCEMLEPSLYRCPGIDAPLCDPDFERNSVQCVKITKDGVLLQQLPEDAM
jgi:hypothetical protein